MGKYLIVNNAKLPYKIIGKVIDDYKNDFEDTLYVGKLELLVIDYKDKLYSVSVRYLKKYIEFRFENYMEADNDKKRNISKD